MTARGRFAPTPSGPLHFGSLVAALASYCQARAKGSEWLLRIEDVDTPRVVKGAADQLQKDIESFGFEWDGPVLFQSQQFDRYQEYLDQLIEMEAVYACQCSRKQLRRLDLPHGPLGLIYPASCRHLKLNRLQLSLRFETTSFARIEFQDQVYQTVGLHLSQQVGDFVLKRVDGIYAYHLAVVVDDEVQGIKEVVRGADLLENTCLHIALQQSLGFNTPNYLHLPLVTNQDGAKLSKQTGAAPINPRQAPQLLVKALQHLGQKPDSEMCQLKVDEVLGWAIANWRPAQIPRQMPKVAETKPSSSGSEV